MDHPSLAGKKIIIGVSGSIAAYKSAILTRLLIKAGCSVRIVLTPSASSFITPLTFSTLSRHEVFSSLTSEGDLWNNHVDLGLWADAMIIAPATAHTLAKMALGLCDNVLQAVYLSCRCPVFIAPSMDEDMWLHPATRTHVQTLISYKHMLLQPERGELASGLTGEGRMMEPHDMVSALDAHFGGSKAVERPFSHQKVMITAGPTQEPIDPVRFISNHSTGKMGFALAEAFAIEGAMVTLITGPVKILAKHPSITTVPVVTAEEMYAACLQHAESQDVIVMAAAVGDYAPETIHTEKVKETRWHLTLKKNTDIARELGKRKAQGQCMVGFALETDEGIENAKKKLLNKNLDLIVLNSLKDEGAGFGTDTNKITIMDKMFNITEYPRKSKQAVAMDILEAVKKQVKP